jgi:integrase
LVFPSQVGTPLSSSNLLKEFKALAGEARISQIRFHDLRHTAASLMLNRGKPLIAVSRILGHSKPSTTMDIYGHLMPILHEEIGNEMDEWLTPIPVMMGEIAERTSRP